MLTSIPKPVKATASTAAHRAAHEQSLAQNLIALGQHDDVGDGKEQGHRPGRQRGQELANHNLAATGRREQQRFKGGAFPLAADAIRTNDQADEQAERDR